MTTAALRRRSSLRRDAIAAFEAEAAHGSSFGDLAAGYLYAESAYESAEVSPTCLWCEAGPDVPVAVPLPAFAHILSDSVDAQKAISHFDAARASGPLATDIAWAAAFFTVRMIADMRRDGPALLGLLAKAQPPAQLKTEALNWLVQAAVAWHQEEAENRFREMRGRL